MKKRDFFRKNKRAQFYLIAAIVIAGLIIGVVGVQNSSKRVESTKVFDLKEELQFESDKAIIHAIDNDDPLIMEDLARDYQKFVGSTINITYVSGNQEDINVYYFEGNIQRQVPHSETDNVVYFTVDENQHSIKIHKGLNFHFIISERLREERYVTTSF